MYDMCVPIRNLFGCSTRICMRQSTQEQSRCGHDGLRSWRDWPSCDGHVRASEADRNYGRCPRNFGDALIAVRTRHHETEAEHLRLTTLKEKQFLLLRRPCFHHNHNGPPHNNTSRLFWRPDNRSSRVRVVPSSGCLAEICSSQSGWKKRRRLLILKHHHGRGLPDPERGARKDGKH